MTQKEKIDFIIATYGNTAVSAKDKETGKTVWLKQNQAYDLESLEEIQVSIQYASGEMYCSIEVFEMSWSMRMQRMMQVIGVDIKGFAEMTGYSYFTVKRYYYQNDDEFPQSIKSMLIVFEWCYRKNAI